MTTPHQNWTLAIATAAAILSTALPARAQKLDVCQMANAMEHELRPYVGVLDAPVVLVRTTVRPRPDAPPYQVQFTVSRGHDYAITLAIGVGAGPFDAVHLDAPHVTPIVITNRDRLVMRFRAPADQTVTLSFRAPNGRGAEYIAALWEIAPENPRLGVLATRNLPTTQANTVATYRTAPSAETFDFHRDYPACIARRSPRAPAH